MKKILIFILILSCFLIGKNDDFKSQLKNESYGYGGINISEGAKKFVFDLGIDSLNIHRIQFWPVNAEINESTQVIDKMDYGVLKFVLKAEDTLSSVVKGYNLICTIDSNYNYSDKYLSNAYNIIDNKSTVLSDVRLKKSSQDTLYKFNYSKNSNFNYPPNYWSVDSINLIVIDELKIKILNSSILDEKSRVILKKKSEKR